MATSFVLRVLHMIADEFRTIPNIGTVGIDLLGYQQLAQSKFPAVFVVRSSGGASESQPAERQRMELQLLIIGYIRAPAAVPDGITEARETFYQAIENKLLGAELRGRFDADFLASGQQVLPIEVDSGAETDEGQTPPFGYFTLPIRAILHYPRGGL